MACAVVSSDQSVEVCDATGDDGSTIVGYIKSRSKTKRPCLQGGDNFLKAETQADLKGAVVGVHVLAFVYFGKTVII